MIHWPSFKQGFIDGLTGGPLWCLFGRHKWHPVGRVHPQQNRRCLRCGKLQPHEGKQ